MTRKNTRALDAIANDIHVLEQKSIIEIGDLLLEAKAQCEHGQWLDWLIVEFEWSVDTAERYMKVAELGSKFRRLRNLKLGKTTLYELADYESEEDLPAIITELAKHATKSRLAPHEAARVIRIGAGRSRFGDHPDAALYRLAELQHYDEEEPWYPKAIAALKELQPTTDEGADAIVDDIRREDQAEAGADAEDVDAAEAAAILNGAPPALPPPSPPQDQRLPPDTPDLDVSDFVDAVKRLCRVSTRTTVAKLADAVSLRDFGLFSIVSLHDLGMAHDLIAAVLKAADKKDAA